MDRTAANDDLGDEEVADDGGGNEADARWFLATATVITVVALAVAGFHMVNPKHVDNVVLVLLGIAAVPWLGRIFKILEVGGVIKAEYRGEIQTLKRRQRRVEETTFKAVGEANSPVPVEAADVSGEALRGVLGDLEREYAQIRQEQSPGHQRTWAMTQVVGKMGPVVRRLEAYDIEQALREGNGAERLSAFVFALEHPDKSATHERLKAMVDSLTARDPWDAGDFLLKPFEQYWGLQALERVVRSSKAGAALDPGLVKKLRELQSQLKPGTDRHVVLSRILRSLAER